MTTADPVAHIRHLPVEEQRKYCLARRIWSQRNDFMRDREGQPTRLTWGAWFIEKHKQSLEAYFDECKARGLLAGQAKAVA